MPLRYVASGTHKGGGGTRTGPERSGGDDDGSGMIKSAREGSLMMSRSVFQRRLTVMALYGRASNASD